MNLDQQSTTLTFNSNNDDLLTIQTWGFPLRNLIAQAALSIFKNLFAGESQVAEGIQPAARGLAGFIAQAYQPLIKAQIFRPSPITDAHQPFIYEGPREDCLDRDGNLVYPEVILGHVQGLFLQDGVIHYVYEVR